MEKRDALTVINQDVSSSALKTLCLANHVQSVVILSTHRIFPNEKEAYLQVGADVRIITFSDLLTEEDMMRCDQTAENILHADGGCVNKAAYASRFMSLSLIEKHRIVHQKLLSAYRFDKVFYSPGLGVAESYWKKIEFSHCIPAHNHHTGNPFTKALQIGLKPFQSVLKIARKIFLPAQATIVHFDGKMYIFLSSVKRLRIRQDIHVYEDNIFLTKPNRKNIYCMSIHGYDPTLAGQFKEVLIFVDGYHPSNYPRSYIDSYGKNSVFVVRTMIDQRWFAAYGKATAKPPAFLDTELFSPCMAYPRKKVLIALNHAGDWTSLINRSDTDELVIAAAEMARNLPHVIFRIRTHPTMNHPAHEGPNSSARIEQFVQSCGLANLRTSSESLQEDLEWSDICLSEYSQVLLDAMRNGKVGVAVNLTRRHSFMQDYANLGFFHANDVRSAIILLRNIAEDPDSTSRTHNLAVEQYNTLLHQWLDRDHGLQ